MSDIKSMDLNDVLSSQTLLNLSGVIIGDDLKDTLNNMAYILSSIKYNDDIIIYPGHGKESKLGLEKHNLLLF